MNSFLSELGRISRRLNEATFAFVNADGSDNRQLTKLGKVATPAAWSPDGRWISFRLTDERYWSDPEK